ncbi:MAG TPA: rRNA maturation RNase YbeY [Actinomycetota bacterium]|nr:rRNA maturation RNase YbeY [Actinomycetota bacterium]
MDDDGSQPHVALSDRQDLPVDGDALADLARSTLVAEGVRSGELSLSFVTGDEIADLHQRYMDEPGPTDVLSFPQDDPRAAEQPRLIGDVVVCPRYALEDGRDLEPELRLLVVHGVLHLLGYDHEAEEERRAMWERQERYAGMRP